MESISPNTIITRNKDVVFNKLDDEIIMMSAKKGDYYGLDSIGAIIWQHIENPITFEKLIFILLEEFDVTEQECLLDVTEFILSLEKNEIINLQKAE